MAMMAMLTMILVPQEEEERMTRYQEEMLTRVMELHQVIAKTSLSSEVQININSFVR